MPLATVFKPVVVFRTKSATLATFGGKKAPLKSALAYISDYDTTIVHLILPPSSPDHPGFQKIELEPKQHKLHVDGVLVTPGKACGMYSRDCPIVFLMDTKRHEGVLVHCGRPAMTPRQTMDDPTYTVITAALLTLIQRGSNMTDMSVVITASICQDCFVHNPETDANLILPFYKWDPSLVDLETGGLNLTGAITAQLVAMGIPGEAIKHDGFCTKKHQGLASKRGGDKDSNLVIAFISS